MKKTEKSLSFQEMTAKYRVPATNKSFLLDDSDANHLIISPGFHSLQIQELGHDDEIVQEFARLWMKDELDAAKQLLVKVIEEKGVCGNEHIGILLASVLSYTGDYSEIKRLLSSCVKTASEELLVIAVNVLFQASILTKTFAVADACSAKDYQDPEFQLHKGRLALCRGEEEKAIRCFASASRLVSDENSCNEFIRMIAHHELNHIFTSGDDTFSFNLCNNPGGYLS